MNADDDPTVWSGSDFPYVCLKDVGRTSSLIRAVEAIVRPGDTVWDIGSGTGILALAAARAGARRVLAVEIDPLMASSLRRTVGANHLEGVVEVVEEDAAAVEGPPADVLMAEIIDTALADEMFVPVMNTLRSRGVVRCGTRLLFERYTTIAQLVRADHEYYGFTILAPKHEWPFYADAQSGTRWWPVRWEPVSEPVEVGTWDFTAGAVDADVCRDLVFPPADDARGVEANAVLLTGRAGLADGQVLGAHNSFNGDKLLAVDDPGVVAGAALRLRYRMGGGLHSLRLAPVPAGSEPVVDLRGTASPTTRR